MLPAVHQNVSDPVALDDLRHGLEALLARAGSAPSTATLLAGRPVRTATDISAAALPPNVATLMQRYGLLVKEGDSLAMPFQVRLVDGAVIVTDHYSRHNRAQPDFVDPLWGGPSLNKLLVRGQARRALDLGCGCGVMTIAAASFCDRVVGVDINPRALALSRFNLALNDVRNAEIRSSDLFEAVRGERFDRIVFNAPTGAELRPRNWLEAGEPILERYFSNLLRYLEDEGFAHVSLCFLDRRRSTFWQRLGSWLEAPANLQVVYMERSRIDSGVPLAIWRATSLIRDRANPFDVTAVSRGWMVLARGDPRALRLQLDYKHESPHLTTDFGDRVFRPLLATGRVPDNLEPAWDVERVGLSLTKIEPIDWS